MTEAVVDARARTPRGTVATLLQRNAPAVGIYLASRLIVLVLLAAVARVKEQSIMQYLRGWDSKWYIMIAHYGYVHAIPKGHGNPAQCDLGFFPLLPLIIRATHWLTGYGYAVSGLVACGVLGVGASIALWHLLDDVYGGQAASKGLAYVLFSPAAVVLSMVYSEGAIVLFVSCSLLALRRHRWLLAGLCAAAATALDPVAMAAVVPCVWAAATQWRAHRNYRALLAPLVAPVGVALFFVYLWAHTGSPFEWFRAQRAGWQGGPFGTGIFYSLYKVASHGYVDQNPLAKTLALVAAIALLTWAWKKRPPATWSAYVVTVLLLGAMSPIIGISPRLLLRAFPLLAFAGATLPRRTYQVVGAVLVTAYLALAVLSASPFWTP